MNDSLLKRIRAAHFYVQGAPPAHYRESPMLGVEIANEIEAQANKIETLEKAASERNEMTSRGDFVERVANAIRVVREFYAGTFQECARAAIAECEAKRSEDYEQLLAAYRRLETLAATMRICLEAFDESPEDGYKLIRAALDHGQRVLNVVETAQEWRRLRDLNFVDQERKDKLYDAEMRLVESLVALKEKP